MRPRAEARRGASIRRPTAGARLSRRGLLAAAAGSVAAAVLPAHAAPSRAFSAWVAALRPHAVAKGVRAETYDRVMSAITPDTSVYELDRAQPEFHEALWQYLNRRVSDWRIKTGQARAREYASLLTRVEHAYGVDRYLMLALWGIESAFGDVVVNPKHMRPVLPALAALAYGEPRRRAYWEQELINALRIIDRGWAEPKEMIGSWAGAMGHTQWMPEVWLTMGVDFDGDGRISPFGAPDDALAGTARFLVERGKYRRGEAWGCEVSFASGPAHASGAKTGAAWHLLGVRRADGAALPPLGGARLWDPRAGGPRFLLGSNFEAVRAYNPADSYALAVVHLADRIRGEGPFRQAFPGAERLPTLAEVQEIQRRLTQQGFDTDGTDGRVGRETMRAVRAFQRRSGLVPADGYAGLKLLARLRQGASARPSAIAGFA
jgi:lytic murein transglycosylase